MRQFEGYAVVKIRDDVLQPGVHPIPPGHLANVITSLQMTAPPASRPVPPIDPGISLDRVEHPDSDSYRRWFRMVGQEWMWVSRLLMPDAQLRAVLDHPAVEVYVLRDNGSDVGLLELDFREDGECELAFFGLAAEAIGKGLGRWLMHQAITRAWAHPIHRLWVHTCTFDHPSAVGFYIRSGFTPFAIHVEVHEDPRLSGKMPRDSARHVPLL